MPSEIFKSDRLYKFIKVEEYFEHYQEWDKLGPAKNPVFDGKYTLSLTFDKAGGCLLYTSDAADD